ncbi:MAG: hypothetical protein IT552_09275 [Sphingomonadaceae bacterium]|nr:hypothetical protein [Sphingomonadaceae bacterium]
MTLLAAACAPAPKPIVVAPKPVAPPPVVPATPPMPLPPGGAAVTMKVPMIGADGVRVTPNRGLSREEYIWHLRSGLNVAALNCQGPVWGEIAQNYNRYLQVHKGRLAQSNKAVDSEYVKRYPGQNGLRVRDTKMTDLYNYFALPPVRAEFCDKSLAKSREIIALPSAALPEYSFGALADLDGVFINFFNAFEQYKIDIVEWNARYGPKPSPTPVATSATPATGD